MNSSPSQQQPTATRPGWFSTAPMLFFVLVFAGTSLLSGDFYKIPISAVFLLSSVFSICTMRHLAFADRIKIFSRGASTENLMLMLWIFVLAGAFAQTAKDIGAIDSAVKLTLCILPPQLVMAGLFIASCLISLSIGTSVGTVVALVPIAAGIANVMGDSTAMTVAAVVGGAFFGDNLSFISDTTIAATKTQGCDMKDKFHANFLIVLPAALITLAIYLIVGKPSGYAESITLADVAKTIPYIVVLATAVCGMNVFAVLALGNLLVAITGIAAGTMTVDGWFVSMGTGIMSMGELIVISMLAGGLLETMRENGGINYIISRLSKHVHGKRGAEMTIAAMVSVANLCTANNTVAIISVGNLAKDMSKKFGINPCKAASILDTFSCVVQGLIPYGAQMLMAAALVHLNPADIVPYAYYPMIVGVTSLVGILLRYPKKYS
jgi:Na+/H+ antiporter NhaC